ncbi:MAG TPA: ATP-binding cassette domain-containing protein [Solirubrobacterales bacterium]|nr:ATP-binding cassette domain-containing protein [Solirubrobacterales bacterium]
MSESVLQLEGFSYRYPGAPAPALRDVDLAAEQGEFIVLAGRSAAGKSTLLRVACGLVPHFHGGEVAGSASVAGLDLREHGPADLRSEVGLVAQDPETQVVAATVRGELELPLEMSGEPEASRARAVEEASLALGIGHLLGRSTATLSGGELQRVALAAALVGRPRVILLDEPTSQLDPVAGDELIGLLRRLNEEWGTTVILAEHRLERCLAAADRVVAMAEGRIAFDGEPQAYLSWALDSDAALATPLARLFDGAGMRPAPVSVKDARARLRDTPHERPTPSPIRPDAGRSPKPSGGKAGAALRVKRLWVELDHGEGPHDVIRDLSLAVDPGEIVVLMGRNGAGKSTLLRAIAGLVSPHRGKAEAPRGSALVPQAPGDMLVRERVGDELPGRSGEEALAAVGLANALEADPRDLSGGERQRLAIAIAMAGRAEEGLPGLICLDEPTRGMDTARKHELAARLRELSKLGLAVLVATHDVEFAAAFAERVILMGEGEVLADGSAEEILSGGWYFATEVARALGAGGPITPERGAEMLASETVVER